MSAEQPSVINGDTSDGYHTFNELYAYREAYNALLFNEWAARGVCDVHKAWRHSDGEPCFGGGWFIVVAQTPAGQVSNHYKADKWDLFAVPERERGAEWDGHTPAVALQRLLALAPKQHAVATPSGTPQAAVATNLSSSSSLLPGIDTGVQERLIAEAERLVGAWESRHRLVDMSEASTREALDRSCFNDEFSALAAAAPRLIRGLLQSLVVPARTGEAGRKTKEGRDGES